MLMEQAQMVELVRVNGGWGVKSRYDPALIPKLKALPGARWDPAFKVWRVSVDDGSLLDLINRLNGLGCAVPEELLQRASGLAVKADRIDAEALSRAQDARLYPFQREGVRWLCQRPQALLADEMGLGKTIQVLMALPSGAPVLVVCPAVVKHNWKKEAEKWRPDYRVDLLSGHGSFRWPGPGEILVVNYDVLPEGVSEPARGTILAGDEIHMTKGRGTLRTRRFRILAEAVSARGGRVWGVTGTPLLNRPPELYQVLDNLGLAGAAFGSFKRFYYLFGAFKDGFGTVWGSPKPEVPELLGRVQLRRERAAVLADLPSKTWQEVTVNGMPKSLQRLCDEALEAWEAASQEKMGGLPPFELMSEVRASLALYKTPFVLDLVEHYEEAGEPVVVYSAHRHPVEELAKREGWAAILGGTPAEERARIVESFQAGELKGLALTIKAGGLGITLTHACHAVFVDLEWTPALNTQAEDRLMRIGQVNACQYVILVADHALDARLTEILCEKKQLIAATVHASAAVKVGSEILQEAVVVEGARDAEDPTVKGLREGWLVRCDCGEVLSVNVAGAMSKHPGWKYVKCPECGLFQWVGTDEFVSAEERSQLKVSLERLLGVCDGAVSRDDQGFNRFDAPVARRIYNDLMAGKQVDWLKLKGMLVKYKKTQLEV